MIQCRPRPPLVEVTVTTQSILTSGHDGCSWTSFVRVNFKSLQPRFQMCMAWYERTVSARAHRQRELSVRKLDAAFAQQLLVETFHIVVFASVSRGTDRRASQSLIPHSTLLQLDPCSRKGRAPLAGQTSWWLFCFWFVRNQSHFWKRSVSTRKSSPAL